MQRNSSSGAPPGARLRRSLLAEDARCKASRLAQPKAQPPFFLYRRLVETGGRRPPRREPCSLRSPALPLATTRINKPHPGTVRAPGRFILFCQVQNSESLLRRGARDLERTALRPRRPPLRRAGAPKGRLIGHPGEKNGQRQPQQNALPGEKVPPKGPESDLNTVFDCPTRGRCLPAREPGCVYPNKGSRRDANASAARGRAHRTFYWSFGREKTVFSRAGPQISPRAHHPQTNRGGSRQSRAAPAILKNNRPFRRLSLCVSPSPRDPTSESPQHPATLSPPYTRATHRHRSRHS